MEVADIARHVQCGYWYSRRALFIGTCLLVLNSIFYVFAFFSETDLRLEFCINVKLDCWAYSK